MDWEDYRRISKSSSADNRARRGCRGGAGPGRSDSDYTGHGQSGPSGGIRAPKVKPPTCLLCNHKWSLAKHACSRCDTCPNCTARKYDPVRSKDRMYYLFD